MARCGAASICPKQGKGAALIFVPANITILPMPPKSPELNPVENIWQFMRDNWLSNRAFKSYDDLLGRGSLRERGQSPHRKSCLRVQELTLRAT